MNKKLRSYSKYRSIYASFKKDSIDYLPKLVKHKLSKIKTEIT